MIMRPADYPFWLRVLIVLTLILFAINLFFFMGPTAWILTEFSITPKEILGVLGTLVASFAGAWVAFKFQRLHRAKERTDDEVAAGNRALFTLYEIWNALVQYQKEAVADYRDRPDAWLNLPVTHALRREDSFLFDMKDLSFMLRGDAPTFQLVVLESVRARLVSHYINERERLVLSEVFPKLTAAGIGLRESRPESDFEAILGVGTVRQLRTLTDAIIKNVDDDVESSHKAFVELRTALRKIHPTQKFIDLKPSDN